MKFDAANHGTHKDIVMPRKRPLTFMIVVFTITALAVGCYWASLLISLHRLEAGIHERNVAKLENSIDWSAVRDQLRSEVRGATLRRFYQDALGKQETSGHILGTLLAGTIAPAMLDQFVDSFVTPQGVVDLLEKDPDQKGDGIIISRTEFTDLDEYTIE